MQMLYNSDSYVVVEFDLRTDAGELRRGGYEIVDKFARKEIFIQGAVAESFREGVQALLSDESSVEAFDDYIAGFASLAPQPLMLH
jgi:Protein of unknown function (DUF3567)